MRNRNQAASLSVFSLFLCVLCGSLSPARAQSFGLPLLKSKVVLQRKLPALVQLPGTTVTLAVSGHSGPTTLAQDFKSMLGAELLKEDPRLAIDDRGDSIISCLITEYTHPPATNGSRPGVQTKKNETAPPIQYTRVTGLMRVTFYAKTRTGKTIGSDNVVAKYDEEFDVSGNALSGGVLGSMKNGMKRITGGAKAEDMNPPTDSELTTKLLSSAVHQIVVQLVNTHEPIEVLLAKGKGMDTGVKDAEAGLWSRALEAFETLPPMPRPVDDAYRLYDVGVAYEALAYNAPDIPQATKYLDEAAINYGKAVDSNPGEKYFLAPQKRIETALAHYEKLKRQQSR